MVGLSVVLEEGSEESNKNASYMIKQVMAVKKAAATAVVMTDHQVISSSSRNYVVFPRRVSSPRRHSAGLPPVFLDACFLCKNQLLPGKDIYMYKGDRGFCSVECRCRQILLDEQDEAASRSCHYPFASRYRKMTQNRDGNGSSAY